MADQDTSQEDRHLEPTARRLQKAREEGQVPRSRDLGHLLVLGAALGTTVFAAGPALESALGLVRSGLSFDAASLEAPLLLERFGGLSWHALLIALPFGLAMLVVGALAAIALGGMLLTTKPIEPKLDRIDPIKGLGRIFSINGLVDLVKLTVLALLLIGVAAVFLFAQLDGLVGLSAESHVSAMQRGLQLVAIGVGALLAVLAAAALADVPIQLFRHHKGLRMSYQDVKQENRETEGDPQLKARLRARQREVSRSRMLAAVREADVVITNPTHYAVAIRYQDGAMGAPRVVAKGAGFLAQRIREIAQEAGVPLFEAPPLARALYRNVEVDHEIPSALYTAVAQVLAYIYQLREHMKGAAPAPRQAPSVEVPPGMDPLEEAE